MITRPFRGKSPKIDPTTFIAENAVIIGDVEIGPGVSIWYNCVVRGDTNRIIIGAKTNVQDGTIIHTEAFGGLTRIGERITIGHGAIIHGCEVEDDCLIGMGAIVLSYSKVGTGSLIAAGALVKENEIVPPRTIMAGVPAKPRGSVSDEMLARIKLSCEHYLELVDEYRQRAKRP